MANGMRDQELAVRSAWDELTSNLSTFDLDVLLIATGELNERNLRNYALALSQGSEWVGLQNSDPSNTIELREAAIELTKKICACQQQDGGSTKLVSVESGTVNWIVEGPCVSCPKIVYTSRLLTGAIRFLQGSEVKVSISGFDITKQSCPPTESQLTLSEFLVSANVSRVDISSRFDTTGVIREEDILWLAERRIADRP
jgi:hypothetical protein